MARLSRERVKGIVTWGRAEPSEKYGSYLRFPRECRLVPKLPEKITNRIKMSKYGWETISEDDFFDAFKRSKRLKKWNTKRDDKSPINYDSYEIIKMYNHNDR